jgi:glyoxylase-like metal-dependent hydrolase (beta-lactamase superfamily II)
MVELTKVAEDLYFIPQPIREGWHCGVILVLGADAIGLVDTGFEHTPQERIFPALGQLGRRPDEIQYVINTHRDGDHVLGNQVIKAHTSAIIAIHELEADAVAVVDVRLREGDIVGLGTRQFQVIHTPGHRPGSICLYDRENTTLLTGDSVCGDRTDLIRMDPTIYMKSLKNLLSLDVHVLVMSHPFQPLGKSILHGTEAQDMIHASIDIAEVFQTRQSEGGVR